MKALFGACFAGFGTVFLTMVIVRGDLFSRRVQDTIVALAPWLDVNPTGSPAVDGVVVPGLFALAFIGIGLYAIGQALRGSTGRSAD